MFGKIKLGRNHVIGGIFALMILITGISMIRIGYNQNIVDSYESATMSVPERTKVGMLDSFWQKYTGGTRGQAATQVEAQRAESAVNSTYGFMIGADVILLIAAGVLILQPIIAQRFKK